MAISGDLVRRFFSGSCTDDEKKEVMDFFRDHPERFAAYLTEESWENYHADPLRKVPGARIRGLLQEKIGKAPVRRMVYARLAAASLILVVGLVFLIQRGGRHSGAQTLSSGIAARDAKSTAPARRIAPMETISNGTGKDKVYTLADGSTVRLAGHSAISFHRPFIDDRREIYLKGAAIFTVAKLTATPFTVHCGQIATTALGTVFSVDEQRSFVTEVHLYSGRIVVKKEGSTGKDPFKDIYLEPGQDLILDNARNISMLSYSPSRLMGGVRAAKKTARPLPQTIFTFNRQSLAEILDVLQHACGVSIHYDTNIVRNIAFTGSFNKDTESLESFLATLCSLNELDFTKTGAGHYSIGKN